MKNKIYKFFDFIKLNESNDTPENLIKSKLSEIKKAIEDLFEEVEDGNKEEPENISIRDAKEAKSKKKSLSSMGVKLDSCDISIYSKTDDFLKVKYSDDGGIYDLLISINISDGLPKGDNFTTDDIRKAFIKFKKYESDNIDLIGQLTWNVNIDREDGELKISILKGDNGQAQGQDNEVDNSQNNNEEREEEEKMTLLEFLEFIKSEFEDKYGDGDELSIETE
jgi:hypothetical protein